MNEFDADEGWEDDNPVPRYGLPVARVLADTDQSFTDDYVRGAPLYGDHVFRCTRRADGADCVVKIFQRPVWPVGHAPAMGERERTRAARELDIMRALAQPGVPVLFARLEAAYITQGVISMVMPAYASDLHRLYATPRRLQQGFTNEEVRTVATRVLSALAYLHDTLHVVHRDVKPLNIFLARADDLTTVVLGDVGHSRSLATNERASTTGTSLGTEQLRPPECDFLRPHGRPVDIYQLGASLYVLILCCGPFKVASPDRVFATRALFHGDALAQWNSAAAAGGKVGAARAACVRRMMDVSPDNRKTAAENLEDPWVADTVHA